MRQAKPMRGFGFYHDATGEADARLRRRPAGGRHTRAFGQPGR
jgi:hypothetical protein